MRVILSWGDRRQTIKRRGQSKTFQIGPHHQGGLADKRQNWFKMTNTIKTESEDWVSLLGITCQVLLQASNSPMWQLVIGWSGWFVYWFCHSELLSAYYDDGTSEMLPRYAPVVPPCHCLDPVLGSDYGWNSVPRKQNITNNEPSDHLQCYYFWRASR